LIGDLADAALRNWSSVLRASTIVEHRSGFGGGRQQFWRRFGIFIASHPKTGTGLSHLLKMPGSGDVREVWTLPLFWAQAQPPGQNESLMALLALKRWCNSLTLTSPQTTPSLYGLWSFLAALGALLILVILCQGPTRALKQLFDLAGHVNLVSRSTRRVWRAGRLVAAAIGFTVLAWTAGQALVFARDSGKTDLQLLTKTRSLGEIAVEHGTFAGLTPLRDLAGLGDNLPLVIIAATLVFRVAFEPASGRFGPPATTDPSAQTGPTSWTTLSWGSLSLYAIYRVVGKTVGSIDLPLGGCLVVEAVLVPVVMLVSDGILLAWVLSELRNASFEQRGEDRLNARQAIALMPGAALACAIALPARYVATTVWLSHLHLPTSVSATQLGRYIRWQLGWGLIDFQAAAIVFIAMTGGVAWSQGKLKGALRGYLRLLSAQGGRVIAAIAMAGVAASIMTATAYALVLLLPVQTWVLAAADSYAHFASLPVGLWLLAAFVDLAERSLPTASVARAVTREAAKQLV
jgi:hypothetical protein